MPRAADNPADTLLLMGRIGKPHGVMGEVKVVPETDDPQRFDDLKTVYVGERPEQVQAREVVSVRHQHTKRGLTVLLKLASVEDREAAASLRGLYVFAHEDDLPPLEDDEYYLHDLIGLRVQTEAGETVGTVDDILEMPGNEVLVVARPGAADVLIPAVSAFIAEIDFDAGQLTIRPIEGLLE